MLVFFAGKPLLRLWVGDDYASAALPILEILAIGQTIRLALTLTVLFSSPQDCKNTQFHLYWSKGL